MLKVWARRHRDLARPATRWFAGCTRCCASWSPAGSPRRSPQAQAPGARQRPPLVAVAAAGSSSPPTCSATYGASTRSSRGPRSARPRRSAARHLAHRDFGVGPSSPPPSSATPATSPASPPATTSPPTTAPHRSKCPRGTARSTGCPGAATADLNHAIHMAAVTQIRHHHSHGRAYYDRKLAEGKTRKEALRCLKRQISDAIYAGCSPTPAGRAAAKGPGGQPGNDSASSVAGSHPEHRLFGQATPGPEPSLRAPATFTQPRQHPSRQRRKPSQPLDNADTKRIRSGGKYQSVDMPSELHPNGRSVTSACFDANRDRVQLQRWRLVSCAAPCSRAGLCRRVQGYAT